MLWSYRHRDWRRSRVMSGPRSARVVTLSVEERAALEALSRRTTAAAGLVRRARMVLLADTGMPLDQIARMVGADRTIVRSTPTAIKQAGSPRCRIVRSREDRG